MTAMPAESHTGTTKVRMLPLMRATMPSSGPTVLVTGTNIVSIQPAAPEAMGLPLLIFDRRGSRMTVKTSRDTLTMKP